MKKRPYTDALRRLLKNEIKNDCNAEFYAGLNCLNNHFENRGLIHTSSKFWNWFKNQYEYFAANAMIDCCISPEETELKKLEKEALLSAYKNYYRDLIHNPPFPPSNFFTKHELSITI